MRPLPTGVMSEPPARPPAHPNSPSVLTRLTPTGSPPMGQGLCEALGARGEWDAVPNPRRAHGRQGDRSPQRFALCVGAAVGPAGSGKPTREGGENGLGASLLPPWGAGWGGTPLTPSLPSFGVTVAPWSVEMMLQPLQAQAGSLLSPPVTPAPSALCFSHLGH